jgi:hypothetical protein
MMPINRTFLNATIRGAVIATLVCAALTYRLCFWREPYPKPEIYRFATNVTYATRVRGPGNDARIIRFTTPNAPEAVLRFYAESLVQNSWRIDYLRPDEAKFSYVNGEWSPVFSLRISLERRENMTVVVIDQFLDGSSSKDWPAWPEMQSK